MTDQPTPEPDFDQETVTKFWSKVDKTEACWTWTGSIDQHGYGYFRTNGRRYAAHRFSYLLARGDIPKGLVVDHLCHGWDTNCKAEGNWCRHRSCVNPDHLEAVTQRENLLRGHGVSGQAARRTYCPQGHPYDEANTYFQGGDRRCRACREARKAAARIVPPSAERTHCPQGHPYDEENTYRRPSGHRSCRTCRSEQARRSRQGQPARRKAQTLPPTADRAAILHEAADRMSRKAAALTEGLDDLAIFVGKARAVEAEILNREAAELRRLVAEAPQQSETATPASTAPLAFGLPLVKGHCPACRRAALFLGNGGYPTCANPDCPEPDAATTVLEQYGNEAHPPSHGWLVELRHAEGHWSVTFPSEDEDAARSRYARGQASTPDREWRLVRETRTYTVVETAVPESAAATGDGWYDPEDGELVLHDENGQRFEPDDHECGEG